MGVGQSGATSALDEVAALLDWKELEHSASSKGEPGWPTVALFRALLLAMWHDLSDVRLAEALEDRASFRRFCGFATNEPTPERTASARFRAELVKRKLDRTLFDTVTRQPDARGVVVRTSRCHLGSIGQHPRDTEARWAGHRRARRRRGHDAGEAQASARCR